MSYPTPPRTEPGVRHSRTGLPPRVDDGEARRTRSSPGDTLVRRGVRGVSVWIVFPSALVLGSPPSAEGCPPAFARFVATTTRSDFSGPYIIGYGAMPSRCGPHGPCRWPATRSPGSRAGSVRTCQGLRPRGVVGRLALAPSAMLPSAVSTASAPRSRLSRLNGWPMRSPVNASTHASRRAPHELGVGVGRYSFTVSDFHRLLLAGLPAHRDAAENGRSQDEAKFCKHLPHPEEAAPGPRGVYPRAAQTRARPEDKLRGCLEGCSHGNASFSAP